MSFLIISELRYNTVSWESEIDVVNNNYDSCEYLKHVPAYPYLIFDIDGVNHKIEQAIEKAMPRGEYRVEGIAEVHFYGEIKEPVFKVALVDSSNTSETKKQRAFMHLIDNVFPKILEEEIARLKKISWSEVLRGEDVSAKILFASKIFPTEFPLSADDFESLRLIAKSSDLSLRLALTKNKKLLRTWAGCTVPTLSPEDRTFIGRLFYEDENLEIHTWAQFLLDPLPAGSVPQRPKPESFIFPGESRIRPRL